eukprot:maker-scaffold_28-snap-gene-4.87-mRNA-1 protein AED:0.01 eAED:0.01 QI:73/1/1/1/0.5/0.66/3/1113/208
MNENDQQKSRKRKKPTQFHGYDPSIISIPGDPRLHPQKNAKWLGVNYHASQPINNAWRDWAASVVLFDIFQNILLIHRRVIKAVGNNKKIKNEVKGPERLQYMQLHPAQPVASEWDLWKNSSYAIKYERKGNADISSFVNKENKIEVLRPVLPKNFTAERDHNLSKNTLRYQKRRQQLASRIRRAGFEKVLYSQIDHLIEIIKLIRTS